VLRKDYQENADDTFGLPLMVVARRVVLALTQKNAWKEKIVLNPLRSFPFNFRC
jgi:hypothetical protein